MQRDHFFGLIVEPLAPARTAERMHIYFVGEEALQPVFAPLRDAVVARWREINGEDIAIVERMQLGRASRAFDGGRLSPAQDPGAHHFMKMVAERLRPTEDG